MKLIHRNSGGSLRLSSIFSGLLFIPGLLSFAAGVSLGEDSAPTEHPVVLRISSEILNSMLDSKDVERHLDVHENILGTNVYGKSHVAGQPTIQLSESPDKARFYITLKGTVTARTTGYNGPVVVQSRAVSHFTASKLVVLEPGRGFLTTPAKVTATTRTSVDSIASIRGGFIGRIVRRRATKIEAGQHNQVQEIVRQRVEKRIQAAFDKTSNERLARANENMNLRAIADNSRIPAPMREMKYCCCTTPRYLQIAAYSTEQAGLIKLPLDDPDNPRGAPIEIWLHESAVSAPVAMTLDMLTKQAGASNLGLTVATAIKLLNLSSQTENQIPAGLAEQQIHLHNVQDWRVAKMEIPREVAQQMVQVLRPDFSVNAASTVVKTAPAPKGLASVVPTVPKAHPKPAANSPPQLTTEPKPGRAVAGNPMRTWRSGKHSATAQFVSLDGDTVNLKRDSGVNTSIAYKKLSETDQAWINSHLDR